MSGFSVVWLAAALAAAPARAQHDHGGGAPPSAEHDHAPPSAAPPPAAPPPSVPTPVSSPVPDRPADEFERFRRENPALGAKMDEFMRSITRDNPGSAEQAKQLALQIGGALAKIEKLKALAGAGKIDGGQFKAMKAEALEGVSGALHGLMQSDNSNGLAMRAVHRHFDGPLKGVGFDVGRHAKEMYGAHPGGFTGRYLAGVEQDAGRWPKAVEYAKQSLAYEPKNVQALGIVARGLFEQGDYAGAHEAAKAALALDRADPVANTIAGLTKGRSGPSQGAEEPPRAGPASAGTAFFAPAPDRPVPTFPKPEPGAREAASLADKAQAYLRVGDRAAAQAAAEKALALEPGQKRAALALGAVFMARRDYLKVLALLQEALRASGGRDPDLLAAQSGVLNRLGRYAEALASADLALSANPANAAAHLNRAWALSGLGRRAEALGSLREAARFDSRYLALLERASSLPPDGDLVALFAGEGASAQPAPKEAPVGRSGGRAAVVGVVAAGLLLVLLGVTQGGAWAARLTRSFGRLGKASPSVQPMPAAAPSEGGLAASGIRIEGKIGQGGMGVV
ncbi:tetratricopeptide repeat protein, partial [bacterium]